MPVGMLQIQLEMMFVKFLFSYFAACNFVAIIIQVLSTVGLWPNLPAGDKQVSQAGTPGLVGGIFNLY